MFECVGMLKPVTQILVRLTFHLLIILFNLRLLYVAISTFSKFAPVRAADAHFMAYLKIHLRHNISFNRTIF